MVKRSIYFVWTANADTELGNRDRLCDVLGEVILVVLRHYSRQEFEEFFV